MVVSATLALAATAAGEAMVVTEFTVVGLVGVGRDTTVFGIRRVQVLGVRTAPTDLTDRTVPVALGDRMVPVVATERSWSPPRVAVQAASPTPRAWW